MRITSTGQMVVTLESPTLSTSVISTTANNPATNTWVLLSYTVSYASQVTTITPYLSAVAGTPSSNTNLLFRETVSSVLTLGMSSVSNFNGFIYNFKLWNTAYTSFTIENTGTELCSGSGGSTCFGTCSYLEYFSASCQACLGICTTGCTRANSCNICWDPLCAICTGFGIELCTNCVTNASGVGLTACTCNTNYMTSTDGFSCQ